MYGIYNVFHISLLQNYITNESNKVISYHIKVQLDFTFIEKLERILSYNVKQLWNKKFLMY